MACVITLGLASCGGNQARTSNQVDEESNEVNIQAKTSNQADEESNEVKIPQGWQVSKKVDDLTNDVTAVQAMLFSNTVIVNRDNHTFRLAIDITYGYSPITDGLCNSVSFALYDTTKSDDIHHWKFSDIKGSGILAVFDNGPVDNTWSLIERTDDLSNLYMSNPAMANAFIEKIKTSKTCKIQVNLDTIGMKTFKFNCQGLQWGFK